MKAETGPVLHGTACVLVPLMGSTAVARDRAEAASTISVSHRAKAGLLASELKLSGTELASCGGLLFEELLLLGIGVANLNDVFVLIAVTDHREVVELLDYFFADVAALESSPVNDQLT